MGVYKRGSTWTAHMSWTDLHGKRAQKTKGGFQTKKQAEAFHRDFLSRVARGAHIAAPKMTLEDFLLDRWLPQHSHNIRASTAEAYRSTLTAYIIPLIGRMKLDEIRTIHLENTYNQLLHNGRKSNGTALSPKTVINVASTVRSALHDAVRWELIAHNPADSVKLPRRQRKEMSILEPSELQRYLEFIRGLRLCAVYQLTALTGMRRGEVLALQWDDIDFDTGTITVRHSRHRVGSREVIESPKTEKSRRTIHIDRDTLAKLKSFKAVQNSERLAFGEGWPDTKNHVVTRADGTIPSISAFYYQYKKTIAESGVRDVTFHALRHSYATAALVSKHDLKTVSARLGHSETSVTANIYYHAIQGQDEVVAESAAQSILTAKTKSAN